MLAIWRFWRGDGSEMEFLIDRQREESAPYLSELSQC